VTHPLPRGGTDFIATPFEVEINLGLRTALDIMRLRKK
jgi:hypothetical protein